MQRAAFLPFALVFLFLLLFFFLVSGRTFRERLLGGGEGQCHVVVRDINVLVLFSWSDFKVVVEDDGQGNSALFSLKDQGASDPK
jgi:hypothetical protein